jgi:hypothetical protein
MADCIIPTHYPNQIDITRTPLAFGDRAVPRLVNFFFLLKSKIYHKPKLNKK